MFVKVVLWRKRCRSTSAAPIRWGGTPSTPSTSSSQPRRKNTTQIQYLDESTSSTNICLGRDTPRQSKLRKKDVRTHQSKRDDLWGRVSDDHNADRQPYLKSACMEKWKSCFLYKPLRSLAELNISPCEKGTIFRQDRQKVMRNESSDQAWSTIIST